MTKSIYDRIGIVLSSLCIVHCLCMPFISAALLVWGITLGSDEVFHRILLILLTIVGLVAFIPGIRKQKTWSDTWIGIIALALSGFLCISTSAIFGEHEATTTDIIVNITGSLMLISAHILNHTVGKEKECCDHKD